MDRNLRRYTPLFTRYVTLTSVVTGLSPDYYRTITGLSPDYYQTINWQSKWNEQQVSLSWILNLFWHFWFTAYLPCWYRRNMVILVTQNYNYFSHRTFQNFFYQKQYSNMKKSIFVVLHGVSSQLLKIVFF